MSGNEPRKILPPNSTVLAWVEELSEAFEPEVGNRCIAVSEMEVNRSNLPTLPIAMTALVDVTFRHAEQTNKPPVVVEQMVTEFWFKSNRVRFTDNKESPFWAYYDYDPLLRKFVTLMLNWRPPRGNKLKVTRMDLESDEMAVHITFEFFHQYDFCPLEDELGEPVRIVNHACAKTGCEDIKIGV